MGYTPFGERAQMWSDLGEEEIRLLNGASVPGAE